MSLHIPQGPQRIVCLTEETTEWLYLLGQEARIVGISGYTVRPRRAREEKPRVSAFLSARFDKILALQPDCVFGFSDLQADIASALIRQGVQVTVFNQRSVDEIFSVLFQVAAMVGQGDRGLQRLAAMRARLDDIQVGRAVRHMAAIDIAAQAWSMFPMQRRVTFTRDVEISPKGQVYVSSASFPSWHIEDAQPTLIEITPR